MDVRGLKEGALVVVVPAMAFGEGNARDLTVVGGESTDLREAKSVARESVPVEVPATAGEVVAYVVRVEAVLPFRPRLTLAMAKPEAKETTTEAQASEPVDLG